MATAITEFEKYIAVDVIDCPEMLITFAVQRAIVEFCTKTNIYTYDIEETIDSDNIDSSLNDFYDVDLSSYTDLTPVTVFEINIDGVWWTPGYMSTLSDITHYATIKDSSVKYFNFPDANTIRIYNIAVTDTALVLKMSFTPPATVTSVDDFLFTEWAEPIIAGAKYRILSMPEKVWTNEKAAIHNQYLFRAGVTEAIARVTKGFTRSSTYAKPRGYEAWGI